jgi:hypothetical protein
MLYAIARELDVALRAQHVPFGVVFGPEPAEALTSAKERVVFEHRGQGADSFSPPTSKQTNPEMPFIRIQGARILVYARSNVLGATWHDHTERAEHIVDHVLAELDQIVRSRRNTMRLGSGGFLELKDAAGSDVRGVAVYSLDFSIDRGVFRRTWEGRVREEVIVGTDVTIVNTTKVSNGPGPAGMPPLDADTI